MNRLLAIPIVCAAIAAGGMLLDDPSMFYRSILIAAAFATSVSALVTMGGFSPGDKLFTAWLMLGSGYALAGIRYLVRLYGLVTGADPLSRPLLDGMLILQNVLIAISLLWFVRAWRETGLAMPLSRSSSFLWIVIGVVVAVVVGGYPLVQGIATARADTVLLVSTLGDIVGIALIVPLALSALALRGGLLMHAWIYLAACEVFWLAYDVWLAFRQSAGVGPRVGQGVEQMVRVMAIMFAFVATIAQRRAIRPLSPLTPRVETASTAV
jgi:hypothetical protein